MEEVERIHRNCDHSTIEDIEINFGFNDRAIPSIGQLKPNRETESGSDRTPMGIRRRVANEMGSH